MGCCGFRRTTMRPPRSAGLQRMSRFQIKDTISFRERTLLNLFPPSSKQMCVSSCCGRQIVFLPTETALRVLYMFLRRVSPLCAWDGAWNLLFIQLLCTTFLETIYHSSFKTGVNILPGFPCLLQQCSENCSGRQTAIFTPVLCIGPYYDTVCVQKSIHLVPWFT